MREFLCGRNTVIEAIKNELPIESIITTRKGEIQNLASSSNFSIKESTRTEMDKMTKENHQGFIAIIKPYNYYDLDTVFKDKPSKILILDHIQDPHNLGAIIRSANAAGVFHIIIPKNRAASISLSSLKVASGGHVGIKVIKVNSLIDAISKLKQKSFWIYSSTLENANPIDEVVFNYPLAIIVGNEQKGVSRTLIKHSDDRIYIPMKGNVESLNVSVAAGIMLFKI